MTMDLGMGRDVFKLGWGSLGLDKVVGWVFYICRRSGLGSSVRWPNEGRKGPAREIFLNHTDG